MNTAQQTPCNCATCPDTGCTCGNQPAAAQAACGPQCQCPPPCLCNPDNTCAQS